MSELPANTYQFPLGRRCARASAFSMIDGLASRKVGRCWLHADGARYCTGMLFIHLPRRPVVMLISVQLLLGMPAAVARGSGLGPAPCAARARGCPSATT